MSFIEAYLGFSPDGGDSSFELMLLMMVVTITTGAALAYFAAQEPN